MSCSMSAHKHHILKPYPRIGWREWVGLPNLGIKRIKVKVDSGAKTSALYADRIKKIGRRHGNDLIEFVVYPEQEHKDKKIHVQAEAIDYRRVRSSNGSLDLRPVIITPIMIMGVEWDIELTLADRNQMGFRMLLGRSAIKGRLIIDVARSYLSDDPGEPTPRKKNNANVKVGSERRKQL